MGSAVGPDTVLMVGRAGVRRGAMSEAGAATETDVAALGRRVAALEARLSALEGKPEEVAHFTASAKLPAVAALASFTLVLTGLVPARIGDVLKAGEQVEVRPLAALPPGLDMGVPLVTVDGTVAVPFKASLAIAASSAPIAFFVTALR